MSNTISPVIETTSDNLTTLLKASWLVNEQKKDLSAKNVRIDILTRFVIISLESFEKQFDNDKESIMIDQLEEYCDAADYIEILTGRPSRSTEVREYSFHRSTGL